MYFLSRHKYRARLLILLMVAVGAFVFVPIFIPLKKSGTNPVCKSCNVILITLDVLGSNHLPCYGYKKNTSPTLCAFAGKNIQFTRSYSNASWTLPSMFSIFTSQYPKHHQMESGSEKYGLNTETPTLSEVLKANVYQTIYVGPTDNKALPFSKGINRGFDEVINYHNLDSWQKGYEKLANNRQKGKKSFLYLYSYILHSPYGPELYEEEDLKSPLSGSLPLTWKEITVFTPEFYSYLLTQTEDPQLTQLIKNASSFDEAHDLFESTIEQSHKYILFNDYYESRIKSDTTHLQYIRALYDEEIARTDEHLNKLFTFIAREKLQEDTIIIITSPHGEEFMEHGNLGHKSDNLKNVITAVPLIIHIPGIGQRQIDKLTQGIDIYPTILGLLGIGKPTTVEGIDLTGMIVDKYKRESSDYVIANGYNVDSISSTQWKLYVHYGRGKADTYELFNYELDPGENKNVADKNRQVVSLLLGALNSKIYKSFTLR